LPNDHQTGTTHRKTGGKKPASEREKGTAKVKRPKLPFSWAVGHHRRERGGAEDWSESAGSKNGLTTGNVGDSKSLPKKPVLVRRGTKAALSAPENSAS